MSQRSRLCLPLLGLVVSLAALVCGCGYDPKNVPYPTLPKGAGKIDDGAPKEFASTKSGLEYRVLRKGTGKSPAATDSVEVCYHGWLDSGTVFDSSYKSSQPSSFSLRGVIPGWTEGLQLIGEGGMIELKIPPELGYGPRGQGRIGPNSTLHFLVELLKVK